MSKKVDLVVIDPQLDFTDPKGTLFVPGAAEDMQRLASFVNRIGRKLNDIHITLDSHRTLHISVGVFWRNSHGEEPTPFTCITAKDVEDGKWTTRMPSHYKKALDYLKALEATNRYSLVVWPKHCLIGSWGTQVNLLLFDAVKKWEENEFAVVDYVTKGSNVWTEHFSAVKAEVPEANDPTTQINTNFIKTLEETDEILIAGEALSHCVKHTFTDVVDNFSNASYVKKMVLLQDCCSSVPGFEKEGQEFIKQMVAKGMRLADSESYLK